MKRITKTRSENIVSVSFLAAAMLLLHVVLAQAQAGRLAPKQAKKLEKQAVATTEQTQEKTAPATNEPPATQQNRPLQQALPGINNPRLQAIVLDRFLPRLDLSNEQRGQIQTVRIQHFRRMRVLLDLERVQTRAYDEALFDLSLDQKEIEKRTTQLAETRSDMLNTQAKLFLELRRILTPEQFARLRQLMEEERALRKNAP
jgi:Spy/CpxP family protein refolding chaperone